jgi:hypothetical protein
MLVLFATRWCGEEGREKEGSRSSDINKYLGCMCAWSTDHVISVLLSLLEILPLWAPGGWVRLIFYAGRGVVIRPKTTANTVRTMRQT